MANANRPQGFIPVSHINGSDWDGKTSLYYVQQSDTNPLAVGDVVVSVPGSASALVLGTYQEGLQLVTKATGASGIPVRGVIVSIVTDPIDLGLTALPAVKSKGYLVNVADDPLLIFKVIGDNTTAAANTVIGSYAGFNTPAPATAYGVSQETLAISTVTTTAGPPLLILGLHSGDLSSNCHFKVMFRQHELGSVDGGGSSVQTGTLRPVANRVHYPDASFPAFKQVMTRLGHYSRDNITQLVAVFANSYLSSNNQEAGPGAASQISFGVEYNGVNLGTAKFGGASVGTAADNALLFSDPLTLSTTIPANSNFFSRTWISNSIGTPCSNGAIKPGPGDAVGRGATTTPDLTSGVGTTGMVVGSGFFPFGPVALLGISSRGTVFIIGDSIAQGFKDDGVDAFYDQGYVERIYGPDFGLMNVAIGGSNVTDLASNANRKILSTYCQVGHLHSGTNDWGNGRTATQILAGYAAHIAAYPGLRWYLSTILPRTNDATNAWKQTTTQTTQTGETTVRVAVNTAIRQSSIVGMAGYVEAAAPIETADGAFFAPALNGGLWIPLQAGVAALNPNDGLHPNSAGSQWIANANTSARTNVF